MATSSQKLTVLLAFVAAAFSLAAVVVRYSKSGEISVTPLAGGLLMLALGVGGVLRLRGTRIAADSFSPRDADAADSFSPRDADAANLLSRRGADAADPRGADQGTGSGPAAAPDSRSQQERSKD